MRALVCLFAMTPLAYANIRPDDTETPRSITVLFASGSATFNLDNQIAQTIAVRVGDKQYSAQLAGCIPLEHIRFDTAKFFNGIPAERRDGTFTLTFQMGTEASRAFGELPLIQVSFRDGKVVGRLISRQIAERHGFTSPLCPDDRTTSNAM